MHSQAASRVVALVVVVEREEEEEKLCEAKCHDPSVHPSNERRRLLGLPYMMSAKFRDIAPRPLPKR